MTLSKTEGLKALGANVDRNTYPHAQVDRTLLERAQAPGLDQPGTAASIVTLDCPEFTSLCPMTNQPDFGHFRIVYRPLDYIVESKSLKLYLGSYRQTGEFHEACALGILNDIASLIDPAWIVVKGVFRPRGGIAINPTVSWDRPDYRVPDWVFLKD